MKHKIKKCLSELKKLKCDALLISNPANVTYLTGFREADGYLLITASEEIIYFTNFLYQEEAKKIASWKIVPSNSNIFGQIASVIKKLRITKVGFEAKHLPFLEYKKIKELLLREAADFVETLDLVEGIRAIKKVDEISLIRKSIEISQEAFEFVNEIYDTTMTEKDLSIEIEKFLRLRGDNRIAFPPIIASGKNSAYPHYLAGEAKLNQNFFLIDLGSKYYEYCADLTRVFFEGKIPRFFKRIYDIVRKAQKLSIDKIKEGVKAKDVDKAARQFIEQKGFGKYFGHGLGHGVGLEVHESPYLNQKNEEILKEGMVITVEPAIYIAGKFGIRIEDMVLVTAEGREILSRGVPSIE